MEFIKDLEAIIICDIGASPIDSDNFINELFNNTTSNIIGFEPNINESLFLALYQYILSLRFLLQLRLFITIQPEFSVGMN